VTGLGVMSRWVLYPPVLSSYRHSGLLLEI
jgi:hypothetical protein